LVEPFRTHYHPLVRIAAPLISDTVAAEDIVR